MNNKKAYERKLNNFKDYEIGKLKEITAQQQKAMFKLTDFMKKQDQVLTTMAGILAELARTQVVFQVSDAVEAKGYSKASGMQYLADYLHSSMEDTVAIGDSNNDLAMLSAAHTAIAMGNSSKKVLALADYVTTDVSRDGIYNALEWLGVL